MAETTALKVTPEAWLTKRQPGIVKILDSLRQIKTLTVPNPSEDLNQLHTAISGARNYQEWVKTYLVETIGMELEVKRLLAISNIEYKDALGKAFVTKADIVASGKSFEEKLLRLREHLPTIREKEEWEQVLESVQSLKEAVQLVYDDLSKAAMAISMQVNVIKSQILTGQIKIQIEGFTAKDILSENAFSAIEKASMKNIPNGETGFDKL